MPVSRLVVATRNSHKRAELQAMLKHLQVELCSPEEFMGAPEVEENRDTLEGNAIKKAEALFMFTGLPSMADDTGLEVDALNGAPGVYSARYAGEKATYAGNVAKLLSELKKSGDSDRSARFKTVIAYVDAHGTKTFEGVCEGEIIEQPRGGAGFGYDPVFVPSGHRRTFAELEEDEKNRISHRGRAMEVFVRFLEQR